MPPIGKQKRYSPQPLNYIHALEIDPPADRPPIDWKLVTNLPVNDLAGAVEKLEWHALSWKAEVFHKVMKSGCRAEEARLETAERLAKFPALVAMVSWRIFFITMSARANPEAEPEEVLTSAEIANLNAVDAVRAKPRSPAEPSRPICSRSPCSAATLPETTIRRRETWSRGES